MNLLQTMINPLSPRKGAKIQPEASAAMSGTIAVNGNMKRDVILVFFQDGDYTLVQLKRTGSRYQSFLLDKQAASHHKTLFPYTTLFRSRHGRKVLWLSGCPNPST
jgi:hypothetical protein